MNGRPVWLASISRRRPSGTTLYVPEWSPAQLREAEKLLLRTLLGVGDPNQERLFRMNITLCLHRAASAWDLSHVPAWFYAAPGTGLAGGPVAILRETVPGRASTKPCLAPIRDPLPGPIGIPLSPHAWVPKDCGRCEPCRSRARL